MTRKLFVGYVNDLQHEMCRSILLCVHTEVKSLGIELVEGCALVPTKGPLLPFFVRGKPSNPSTTSSLLPPSTDSPGKAIH